MVGMYAYANAPVLEVSIRLQVCASCLICMCIMQLEHPHLLFHTKHWCRSIDPLDAPHTCTEYTECWQETTEASHPQLMASGHQSRQGPAGYMDYVVLVFQKDLFQKDIVPPKVLPSL